MKDMTEKELLGKTLEELGFKLAVIDTKPELIQDLVYHDDRRGVKLEDLGINLVEEKPEITLKNLGKFMYKFEEYPEASFLRPDGSYLPSILVCIDQNNDRCFEDHNGSFPGCKITDPRWTKENLG